MLVSALFVFLLPFALAHEWEMGSCPTDIPTMKGFTINELRNGLQPSVPLPRLCLQEVPHHIPRANFTLIDLQHPY
ncbi:unnamed protein product [Darwinula stevensoni]|uniref:Uncharacterized protein n=1 Tax=Darwinula stevensoni TaxID=69355 RepID=A0A7R9AF03_9CRUS|nr:unnamed protein product [Darwinula stevensoni]CAG0902510.1 unnamed protein product [Darwinula stevensoni]